MDFLLECLGQQLDDALISFVGYDVALQYGRRPSQEGFRDCVARAVRVDRDNGCPSYAELRIVMAMRSSGLCGVISAARVDAGDCVERYSA